jgi:hypothetical protein
MATTSMPGKLVVVVVLMVIGVVVNLLTGALLSAAIGGGLVLGVLAGNDGVRKFLIGLAAFQILLAVVLLGSAAGTIDAQVILIAAVFAIGIPALTIWTLSRNEVREWMFRKNFHLDDGDVPPSL